MSILQKMIFRMGRHELAPSSDMSTYRLWISNKTSDYLKKFNLDDIFLPLLCYCHATIQYGRTEQDTLSIRTLDVSCELPCYRRSGVVISTKTGQVTMDSGLVVVSSSTPVTIAPWSVKNSIL